MSPSSHLSDNLVLLAHETALLIRTAAALDDKTVRAASRCEGWTRALVLTHLARNADALGRLASWAVTGTPVAMYDSPQARDADILAGSARGAEEIRADLESAAARFASAAADLAGPPEQVEVEMRNGHIVPGGRLPTLRLMEVVFHHVDLDAGYTFADADPDFVQRAVSNAVERIAAKGEVPSLLLHGDHDQTWTLPNDGQAGSAQASTVQASTVQAGTVQDVSGTNAALLLWLARGDGSGVSSDAALPGLPAWG